MRTSFNPVAAGMSLLTIVTMLLIIMLSGCATIEDNLDLKAPDGNTDLTTVDAYGEGVFQIEHVVDTLQSLHGAASDRCYVEGDTFTKAITGAHPSQGATIVWSVGFGLLHFGITDWLLSNGHDRIAAVWEAASIVDTAAVIDHNYSIGIRLGAPNHDDAACIKYYNGAPPAPTSPFAAPGTPPPTTTYLSIKR